MILGIAGATIALLLSIIAVFLNRLLLKFDNMTDAFEGIVLQASLQENTCKFKHQAVDARLNAHSKSIESINEKIKKIK
jgi:hypothetical protein